MSDTAPLQFDLLTSDQREQIREAARGLYAAMMVAPGVGVNGYTPEEASTIDTYAYAADKLIRLLGWYNSMFPPDEEIYTPGWSNTPKVYIWELYASNDSMGGIPIAPPAPTPGDTPRNDAVYPPNATPEEPSQTVWYLKARALQRSNLIEAAGRVVDMTRTVWTGGIQSGDRVNTTTTIYNNDRSVDWAIWKLLLSLIDAGYEEGPPQ